MADHHSTPTHPRAQKEHRCIYCGYPIFVEEQYVQQTGIYDGAPYRNRYHGECFDDVTEEGRQTGDWEFSPWSGDPPERVQAIIDARRAAKDAEPNAQVTGASPALMAKRPVD